jgi:hypothetical protein
MLKTFTTIAAAAVVAALVTAWPAPRVEAGTPALGTVPSVENAATATACTQRAWPYYGQGCATDFDARWRGEPRKVRIVTTDRLN